MKSKYSYLFGNIKLFIIASFIPKALDLCMVSLYTRCLTDADYGIADLLANTVQLIMPVLTLQIQDAVLRDAMDERYQKKDVLTRHIALSQEKAASLGIKSDRERRGAPGLPYGSFTIIVLGIRPQAPVHCG